MLSVNIVGWRRLSRPVLSYRAFSSSSSPLRVVFFGTDNISLHTFSALHAHTTGTSPLISRLELVCTPDRPHRSKKVPCATKAFALQHQLTVHQVPRSVDFRMRGWCSPFMPPDCLPALPHTPSESFTFDQFDYSQPFDVGVVASFGYFIPPRVIASFRYGMINMHPSLLPDYRGSAPIPHAILNGDSKTGVSIITVDPARLDGGHILSQQTFPLSADATFLSLSDFLAARGAEAVISTLQSLSTEQTQQAQRVTQLMLDSKAAAVSMMSSPSTRPANSTSVSTARKAPKLLPAQERIDFQQTAELAYRTFRALHGTHFHAAVTFRGARVNILGMKSLEPIASDQQLLPGEFHFDKTNACLRVRFADTSASTVRSSIVLGITELVVATKKPMTASDFCVGYQLMKLQPGAGSVLPRFESLSIAP